MYLLFFSSAFTSEKKNLLCKITNELENNVETSKKVYGNKLLPVYIDKINLWVNDVTFADWRNQNPDEYKRFNKNFIEDQKNLNFEFKLYHDVDKKKLESSFIVKFNKISGEIKFTKYYYRNNDVIFFISEVRGLCKK